MTAALRLARHLAGTAIVAAFAAAALVALIALAIGGLDELELTQLARQTFPALAIVTFAAIELLEAALRLAGPAGDGR